MAEARGSPRGTGTPASRREAPTAGPGGQTPASKRGVAGHSGRRDGIANMLSILFLLNFLSYSRNDRRRRPRCSSGAIVAAGG
jgi:hypothetical protein